MANAVIISKPYRLKAATIIAKGLQKLTRGKLARKQAKLLQWIQYNSAAFTIQTYYRRWYALKHFYYRYGRCLRDRSSKNNKVSLPASNVRESFNKIVSSKSTYEDKMLIWRMVVELRRGHNFQTTDTCVKAVLESQADMKQATVLMGIPEFCIRHFIDLPRHTKKLFTYDNNSQFNINTMANHGSTDISVDTYDRLISSIQSTHHTVDDSLRVDTRMDTIRALKRAQRRQNLIDTVNTAVSKSCFSKYHVGSKYTIPTYPKLEPRKYSHPATL